MTSFERIGRYVWFTIDIHPDWIFLKVDERNGLAYDKLGNMVSFHRFHNRAKITHYSSNPRRAWR